MRMPFGFLLIDSQIAFLLLQTKTCEVENLSIFGIVRLYRHYLEKLILVFVFSGVGQQAMASKQWPARNGLQAMACRQWPAGNGLQVMACKQ
jgi:hypothetical protein